MGHFGSMIEYFSQDYAEVAYRYIFALPYNRSTSDSPPHQTRTKLSKSLREEMDNIRFEQGLEWFVRCHQHAAKLHIPTTSVQVFEVMHGSSWFTCCLLGSVDLFSVVLKR